MKILFLAYRSFDVYKPIEKELIRQGHEVHTIIDKVLPYDHCDNSSPRFNRFVKRLLRFILRIEKRYWENEFKKDSLIGQYYDELLCYQGVSMSSTLLNYLRRINPRIKCCAYIADSANYYDFYYRKKLFDKMYTFDIKDAERIKGIHFLDAYWELDDQHSDEIIYDISSIGSDHDGRYEFTRKVYSQLVEQKVSYFIRVVSPKPNVENLSQDEKTARLSTWKDKMKYPFMSQEPVPFEDFHRIINSSNCILEIEREKQSGVTIRTISAIAKGKKVITTNEYIKGRPFYNPNQVKIVDRHNPVLDVNWIKERSSFPLPESFVQLRIDYWVKNLLIED